MYSLYISFSRGQLVCVIPARQWMAVSPPTSGSALTSRLPDYGSPLPTPMSPALANANVGAAALDNATVVATTNYVNHTPSPQTTSAHRRLKCFIE